MSLCAKGCGQPVNARGLCKVHYNSKRKYTYYRQVWARHDSIGTARRLQALMAIGYSQGQLSREVGIHQSYISKLMRNSRGRVNADTHNRVVAVYDRLSMTPGPCQQARNKAHRRGWAPPLAWDEDTIDQPDAQPARAHRQRWVPWDERYYELRELGYSDLEILGKLKIEPESMLRQMARYSIKPSAELVKLGTSTRHHKQVAS